MRGITKRFPGVVANDGVDFEARRRRGARAARRERRRQEHALEHPHRALPRRRGRDRALRPAGRVPLAARRARRRHRDGAPALPPRRAVHRRRERRPRRPPRRGARVPASSRAGSSARSPSSASATGSPVDPRARIWQLSVGEQQRVEILKALYREARDPDPRRADRRAHPAGGRRALRDAAARWRAEGRTVIFISHKLHEVMAVADRVTVLRGGRSIATVETARRRRSARSPR